jgi:hypothetical protein
MLFLPVKRERLHRSASSLATIFMLSPPVKRARQHQSASSSATSFMLFPPVKRARLPKREQFTDKSHVILLEEVVTGE